MNSFWNGFEKRAWDLAKARRVGSVLKNKLIRRDIYGMGPVAFSRIHPSLLKRPETQQIVNAHPSVAGSNRVFMKGNFSKFLTKNTNPAVKSLPHLDTPEGQVQIKAQAKLLNISPQDLTEQIKRRIKSVPFAYGMDAPNKELLQRTLAAHEGSELRHGPYSKQTFFGHLSPKVVLEEGNMMATLPKEHGPVRDYMQKLRTYGGEKAYIEKNIPGYQYGSTRLSRHAKRRVSDILERKAKEDIERIAAQRSANVSGKIPKLGKEWSERARDMLRTRKNVSAPSAEGGGPSSAMDRLRQTFRRKPVGGT